MNDKNAINYLLNVFHSFIRGEYLSDLDHTIHNSIDNPAIKELFDLVDISLSEYNNGVKAVKLIADGELNFDLDTNNPVLDPIKLLQSKLKHLIWQTQRIAAGDYSQHIDFIGDFSLSFNQLIHSLQLKQELEKRLEENQHKFHLITENSIDVIWTMDFSTRKFTYMSPSVYNLRGLSVEEAMNESLEQSTLPESLSKMMQKFDLLQYAIENKLPLPKSYDEYKQWKKNGEIIDIEVSTNLICDQNGEPKEILGVSRDISERKKVERELKESEEKYRLITDNTKDIIWKIDIEKLKYNYISPSIQKVTGYSPEEVMKLTLSEALLPDSYQKLVTLLAERLKLPPDPEAQICERFQTYSKNGNTIDVESIASFIRDKNGKAIEILGVSREISERILIENALRESENKLKQLLELQSFKSQQLASQLNYIFNNSSNAIAFFDIDGDCIKFSSCNQIWARNIGYNSNELEGFDISLMPDHETSTLYRRIILRTIKEKHPIEEYIFWKNLHLHVISIPIVNSQSREITSCGSLVYDITDKINANQKIRETEERFFSIFNNSKDAIILLSIQLEIVDANETFNKLYVSTDFPKKNVLNYYVPEEYHKFIVTIQSVFN
jgi:PAS domain S-box-containing protein